MKSPPTQLGIRRRPAWAAASLALEGLFVTREDTREALAVLNGEISWEVLEPGSPPACPA